MIQVVREGHYYTTNPIKREKFYVNSDMSWWFSLSNTIVFVGAVLWPNSQSPEENFKFYYTIACITVEYIFRETGERGDFFGRG